MNESGQLVVRSSLQTRPTYISVSKCLTCQMSNSDEKTQHLSHFALTNLVMTVGNVISITIISNEA